MYSTRRASDKKLVASVEKGCHGERHLCCVAILLFCHYERSINCHREHSAAICYQADCVHHATNVARGRLTFRLRGKSFSSFAMTRLGLSSRTQCGDLLSRRLLLSLRSIAMTRGLRQVQGCHGERPCDSRPSVSKQIASTTPQMWLVAGSHLGFAEKAFQASQ